MLRLNDPVDPRPLALARIGIGLGALMSLAEAYVTMLAVTGEKVALPLWAGLPAVSDVTLLVFVSCTVPAAVAVTAGLFTRSAAAWLTLSTWFLFGWEQQTYSNHMMLCAWLCLWLVFSRSDAAWSLRSRLDGRRDVRFGDQVLLMTQLSVCYFFAGIVKVNETFLSGSLLDRITWPELAPWIFMLMAIGTVVTELVLAVGLWVPRVRTVVAALGVGLHVLIPLAMPNWYPLVAFSLMCLALYPLFFVRRAADIPPVDSSGSAVGLPVGGVLA